MKKEIVSGLALVTLSALPTQALNFGTGNVYDNYLACHRKSGENVKAREAQNELKDEKLLPDKPIFQQIQVPESQIQQVAIPERGMMLKYGVPYPIIVKPEPTHPIYEVKYGVPFSRENMVKPDKFNAPMTKYGINLPR